MKLIDKDALVAEIKRIKKEDYYDIHDEYDGFVRNALDKVLSFIDTLEAKELKKETESIWHDANQQPTMYRKYLVRYSDGRVSGSWERHDDGFIPWKDVIKEHGFTHWCYVEDLIKL